MKLVSGKEPSSLFLDCLGCWCNIFSPKPLHSSPPTPIHPILHKRNDPIMPKILSYNSKFLTAPFHWYYVILWFWFFICITSSHPMQSSITGWNRPQKSSPDITRHLNSSFHESEPTVCIEYLLDVLVSLKLHTILYVFDEWSYAYANHAEVLTYIGTSPGSFNHCLVIGLAKIRTTSSTKKSPWYWNKIRIRPLQEALIIGMPLKNLGHSLKMLTTLADPRSISNDIVLNDLSSCE